MNVKKCEMYTEYFKYLAEGKEVEEWSIRDSKSRWKKWSGHVKLGDNHHALRLKPIKIELFFNKTLSGNLTEHVSDKEAKAAASVIGGEYVYIALRATNEESSDEDS